jgi:hypothetical protein
VLRCLLLLCCQGARLPSGGGLTALAHPQRLQQQQQGLQTATTMMTTKSWKVCVLGARLLAKSWKVCVLGARLLAKLLVTELVGMPP